MQQQIISSAQLTKILMDTKGATFATIVTETEPTMRKTNNPLFDKVVKQSRMNVTLNFNYENSVNSQRAKEGADTDFEASPRKWGERIKGTMLVSHKGMVYVEAKMNGKPQETVYLHKDTRNVISKEAIDDFLPKPKSNKDHQGVEKEIILRDFMITSIKEIAIKGTHYVVR